MQINDRGSYLDFMRFLGLSTISSILVNFLWYRIIEHLSSKYNLSILKYLKG